MVESGDVHGAQLVYLHVGQLPAVQSPITINDAEHMWYGGRDAMDPYTALEPEHTRFT